jgi:hypothetical protein
MQRIDKRFNSLQALKRMGPIGLALILFCLPAAGQIIIDGTDASDHGNVTGGTNHQGWKYMERALGRIGERIRGPHASVVADLGTAPGSLARDAINSAFAQSSLAAGGWTLVHVDGPSAIAQWLTGVSSADTGLLYLPTAGHTPGDMEADELAVINSLAGRLNAFTAAGGGLFAMAETGPDAWGWLRSYAPGLSASDVGSGGIGTDIHLTPEGQQAFPGLTDAELVDADPWHSYFSGDLGAFKVLATAPDELGVPRNLILGAGVTGAVTPEPGPLALLAGALVSGSCLLRRRSVRSSPAAPK